MSFLNPFSRGAGESKEKNCMSIRESWRSPELREHIRSENGGWWEKVEYADFATRAEIRDLRFRNMEEILRILREGKPLRGGTEMDIFWGFWDKQRVAAEALDAAIFFENVLIFAEEVIDRNRSTPNLPEDLSYLVPYSIHGKESDTPKYDEKEKRRRAIIWFDCVAMALRVYSKHTQGSFVA